MRADAPGKGGRDPAMLKVELSVADLSLGIIDGELWPEVGDGLTG